MGDLFYISVILTFFAMSYGFIALCHRLRGDRS